MWHTCAVVATLLPMLFHSILGCCWHHAHSDHDRPCTHSTAEAKDDQSAEHKGCHASHGAVGISRSDHSVGVTSTCGHAHRGSSKNSDPVAPSPCHNDESCDDVHCVYVTPEPVRGAFELSMDHKDPALDSGCILMLNAPITAVKNVDRGFDTRDSSQHRALTQVWVV